jgi:hypothetical protein
LIRTLRGDSCSSLADLDIVDDVRRRPSSTINSGVTGTSPATARSERAFRDAADLSVVALERAAVLEQQRRGLVSAARDATRREP